MTTAIIVQARMTSSRLPGKVLAQVAGRAMLALQVARLRRSRMADRLVVATTTNRTDDELVAAVRSMDCDLVFRGSEHDVLDRYIRAARLVGADVVVRATADCPLLDPSTVDMLVGRFLMGDCDHVEVAGLPDGTGAEVIALRTLEAIAAADPSTEEREHVTLYVRRRPSAFRLARLDAGLGLDLERWSVDTQRDLDFVRLAADALAHPVAASFEDVRRTVAEHPDWRSINAGPLGPIDRELLAARGMPTARPTFVPLQGDL